MRIIIYGLHDPRTDELRYVGKTGAHRQSRRLAEHCMPKPLERSCHKSTWIRSLLANGIKPELRIIEETTEAHWQEREQFWIRHFRDAGARLTNSTKGGEGCAKVMKGRKFSDEHRLAISKALKGHEGLRSRLGVPPTNKLKIDEGELRRLYLDQRMSVQQVADQLQVSMFPIYTRLRALGIIRTRGESQQGKQVSIQKRLKHCKLSLMAINDIVSELARGCKQRVLARRHGVTHQTISSIKRGQSLREITGLGNLPKAELIKRQAAAIAHRYQQGESGCQIAKALNLKSVATVYQRLDVLGIPRRHSLHQEIAGK